MSRHLREIVPFLLQKASWAAQRYRCVLHNGDVMIENDNVGPSGMTLRSGGARVDSGQSRRTRCHTLALRNHFLRNNNGDEC